MPLRRLLTTLTVAATVLLGLPAFAAQAGPKTKISVSPVCGTPKAGEFACFALRRDDVKAAKGLQPLTDLPGGFGPSDLASAYSLPADGGAGATVAIVDAYDDPNVEADLATYRAQYGLSPCTTANGCFKKIDQRGGTSYPAADEGWAGEISLDVDMVSAVAPDAHILLVEADSPSFENLGASVDQAVAQGAKYVSNSYGTNYDTTPGSGEDPTETTAMDVHYNHPGVAVVASSGDGDYGVAYPAASQYVTSVGGTALTRDTSTARGWTESVWNNSYGGPGSGCSVYESKPSFQKDTGCANRAVADVSAVSDPVTGVAVYQTYGGSGWAVYGGTSAASPIIAGVYAVAGTPIDGTYPNSYPYERTSSLNDVTSGANGTCSPAYLCTAGTGYDGPTGLGTPDGVAAFTSGPHGELTGTVTNSDTGAALSGATVTAGQSSTTTDSDGKYDLHVPVGTYDVSATAYGFATKTVTGVAVAEDQTVTEDFPLVPVASSTVSGTVVDDSGHGWPLYARVDIDNVPGGPVFTDPATGHFAVSLPQGKSYTLHVTPVLPGYVAATQTVAVGKGTVNLTIGVKVDVSSCTAPGYVSHHQGTLQTFDGTTAPAGWTVTNADGTNAGWTFTDAGGRGNKTGGTGGFAIVDSDLAGPGSTQDTTLTGPVTDLSGQANPVLTFDTDFFALDSPANVDLSVDGGTTWTQVWQRTDSLRSSHVEVALPQAAGSATAQVRFHYTGDWSWWWEVDDVLLGSLSCDAVDGGLVYGNVTDNNTGAGVNGATVTVPDAPGVSASSAATPDDPDVDDGFYWLFSPVVGTHTVTAAHTGYTSASKSVKIVGDYVAKANFSLSAGQISVSPASVDKTVAWQGKTTATVTLKNTGSATATVKLAERPGSTTPLLAGGGAPLTKVAGKFTNKSLASPAGVKALATKTPADVTPSDAPWQAFASYPTKIQDNLSALGDDGSIYSVFGFDGSADTANLYKYDADTSAWTALAPATDAREAAGGAFLDGKLITTGGWGPSGGPDAKTEIYDPASNSWTTGTANPSPLAGAGRAVLNDKLYLVGGCAADSCGSTQVQVYDPSAGTWSTAANYPVAISWESCGTISGQLICAGGNNDNQTFTSTYAYDPATDTWSAKAPLPADLWGSAYSAANGLLLVSGGVVDNNAQLTNQGYSYDPATDTWSALPNANQTRYRAGSTCGLYRIGGSTGVAQPQADSEVLPGFTQCGSVSDVSWLSLDPTEVSLAAGKSATVTVTLDANVAEITQPGIYTAAIGFSSDTPYAIPALPVNLTVSPPKTWGKIAGTVTSAVDGSALGGVTVQIDTSLGSWTLKTAANGTYQLWLDKANNPLQVIVAKDGWQPQTKQVKIAKGTTVTADFVLKKA